MSWSGSSDLTGIEDPVEEWSKFMETRTCEMRTG